MKILLYLGDTPLGDVNKFAKNRHLVESLKSEASSATADQFTFDIYKRQFDSFIAINFDDAPDTFLRPLKLSVVVIENGYVRFSGDLASRPARSGDGSNQILSLKFNEKFWRLAGDLVCDPADKNSPYRKFTNRPAHLYVQDLINESKVRFAAAGDPLDWDYGTVTTLANKTFEYKDFQTIAKALCDAMNNVEGAGKFDVVIRTDPEDYTHQIVDILAPRGVDKNIIIQYPSDGVYSLWSTDYVVEETNDFASEVTVAGAGELGTPAETLAPIATATNDDFGTEYGYFRVYSSQSNLTTLNAVTENSKKQLAQLDFGLETPQIKLVGRPIEWGNPDSEDNGLAIGDGFYFKDESNNGTDQSGWFRITALDTTWDDGTGVATVTPTLIRTD